MQGRLLRVIVSGTVSLIVMPGCEPPAAPSEPVAETARLAAPAAEAVARGRISFVEGYAAGCEQASRSGQPMLLFFTAAWCEYCHQMADEAFVQPNVVGLSERFVCVLIDADRESDVCRHFHVRGYPTVQFLSPGGTPLNRIVGKKPAHQLVVEMHAALQALARRQSDPGASLLH